MYGFPKIYNRQDSWSCLRRRSEQERPFGVSYRCKDAFWTSITEGGTVYAWIAGSGRPAGGPPRRGASHRFARLAAVGATVGPAASNRRDADLHRFSGAAVI